MRQSKLRVRTLMIAVLVVACSLGICDFLDRTAEHRRQVSRAHRNVCLDLIRRAGGPLPPSTRLPDDKFFEVYSRRGPSALRFAQAAVYHEKLAEKYLIASRRPWLPMAPDPPQPK
jgi:hypothetical protein